MCDLPGKGNASNRSTGDRAGNIEETRRTFSTYLFVACPSTTPLDHIVHKIQWTSAADISIHGTLGASHGVVLDAPNPTLTSRNQHAGTWPSTASFAAARANDPPGQGWRAQFEPQQSLPPGWEDPDQATAP